MVLLQTWGWLTGKNKYFANYLTMQARRLQLLGTRREACAGMVAASTLNLPLVRCLIKYQLDVLVQA